MTRGVATSNKTQETTHWAYLPSIFLPCGPRIAHYRGVGRPCPLPATSGQVPRLLLGSFGNVKDALGCYRTVTVQ